MDLRLMESRLRRKDDDGKYFGNVFSGKFLAIDYSQIFGEGFKKDQRTIRFFQRQNYFEYIDITFDQFVAIKDYIPLINQDLKSMCKHRNGKVRII